MCALPSENIGIFLSVDLLHILESWKHDFVHTAERCCQGERKVIIRVPGLPKGKAFWD